MIRGMCYGDLPVGTPPLTTHEQDRLMRYWSRAQYLGRRYARMCDWVDVGDLVGAAVLGAIYGLRVHNSLRSGHPKAEAYGVCRAMWVAVRRTISGMATGRSGDMESGRGLRYQTCELPDDALRYREDDRLVARVDARAAMRRMTPRQRGIMLLLAADEGPTEIGRRTGISGQRVGQIITQARKSARKST